MQVRVISFFFALAVIAGVFVFMVKQMQPKLIEKKLKIAISGTIPKAELSPENISTIPLFHLHYNLWDTLLASDKSAAIAKSFKASENNLDYSFEIDPHAKFSNGRPITASDVKASIERLINREENGHINAKSTIKSIEALNDQNLIIHLHKPTPAFLFLLSSPEFGIVPKESLDSTGAVVNLSITSGAYTLELINFDTQTATLRRNSFFRRADPSAPNSVELRFNTRIDKTVFSHLIEREHFDFIELQNPDAPEFLKIATEVGYSYKSTVPSLSVFMVANEKTVDEKSAKFFANGFRRNFSFASPLGLEATSSQFFPSKTFGSLQDSEIPKVISYESEPPIKEVVIRTSRKDGSLVEEIKRTFSALGVTIRFVDWDSKEPHHYWFLSQGMNTEHPEIELHLDMMSPYKFIDADESTKSMILDATHESADEKRSAIIKDIGKRLISSGKIIPLTTRAYVHVFHPERVDLNGITNYDGDISIYRMRALR